MRATAVGVDGLPAVLVFTPGAANTYIAIGTRTEIKAGTIAESVQIVESVYEAARKESADVGLHFRDLVENVLNLRRDLIDTRVSAQPRININAQL